MGKSDAPAAPDYKGIAIEQGKLNKESALFNAGLAHVNQKNPYGSITYTSSTDAAGNPVTGMDTTLSPQQQAMFDRQQANRTAMSSGQMTGVGAIDDYTKQARAGMGSGTGEDARKAMVDAVYGQYKSKLDPRYNMEEQQQENRLVQQGITPGSEAYAKQMGTFRRNRDEAYQNASNSAVVQGDASQQQAFMQMMSKYGQTQQNYQDYMGNTSPMMPQVQNTSGTGGGGAAAADMQGAASQGYAADMNSTNVSNANKSANTGAAMSAIAMYAMYAM